MLDIRVGPRVEDERITLGLEEGAGNGGDLADEVWVNVVREEPSSHDVKLLADSQDRVGHASLLESSLPLNGRIGRSAAANSASEAAQAREVDARMLPNHDWNALLDVSCSALTARLRGSLGAMGKTGQKVLDEAFQLELSERAGLAAELVASLDGEPDEDVEAAWAAEIEHRAARARSGEDAGRPWAEARDRARDALSKR